MTEMDRTEFTKLYGEDKLPDPSDFPEYCDHLGNHDECTCDEEEGECDPECPVCANDDVNPILGHFLYCLSNAEHILEEHAETISMDKQAELWILVADQHRKMLTD